MKDVKETIKNTAAGLPWYQYVVIFGCFILGVVGFILPPTGKIDGSVLTFIAEISAVVWGFAFIARLPEYIKAGAAARIKKGDLEIEVSGEDNEDE